LDLEKKAVAGGGEAKIMLFSRHFFPQGLLHFLDHCF